MAHQDLQRDEDLLRRHGQRLTPQRRAVLEIMRSSHGHMTVYDVVREAKSRNHTVSVASVYRILSWLTEYELVSVTDVGGKDLAYEYLGTNRHHHLICQLCGMQMEVPFDLITPLVEDIREQFGFEPRIDHLAVFGTCRQCGTNPSTKGE